MENTHVDDINEGLDDKEIEEMYKKLSDEKMLETILSSSEWKIWDRAWKYLAEQAKEGLSVANPDNKTQLLGLQLQVQFYENIIPNTISRIREEAEAAFERADSKGWIAGLINRLK